MSTTDELPALDGTHEVSEQDRAAYARDGHVVLRGIASTAEVEAYASLITEACRVHNRETRVLEDRDLYGQAFLQTWNLWEVDPEVRSFVMSSRFARIAATLLGVDRVRLYHDQALFKEPGGGITPWHQDAGYWPLDGTQCITMWLPLQDVAPDMGSLQFASGSNVRDLGSLTISAESEARFAELAQAGYPVTEPASLALGDASFHGGWTAHRALANTTDRLRAVMTVIWFADGATVNEVVTPEAEEDLALFLPGCRPGELAASHLNPVLG